MGCMQSSGSNLSEETSQLRMQHQSHGGNHYRGGIDALQGRQQIEAKVVLLGDSGVGKSSVALRFCQGRFSPFHEVTIGAAFLQQIVRLNNGCQLKLHIWDTGGQERFRAMAPLYYRDAHGAVIVYDSSQSSTFDSVKFWLKELRQKGPPNCCMAVAANKSDIPEKQIPPDDPRKFCEAEDMEFSECSAKTGENVGYIFESLANKIYHKMQTNLPHLM